MARHQSPFSLLYNRITLAVLVLIACLLSITLWQLFQKERRSLEQQREVEYELQEIQTRKAALETDLNALSTERGKEELIRTNRDVARPGEEVIVLLDAPIATTSEKIEGGGLWGFIRRLFQ